jgi:hypothetical protein
VAKLSLTEAREDRRALAQRYANLINQGLRDPGVEKVRLALSMGQYGTEDGDDLALYKATADDEMIRIDGPKHTVFVHASDLHLESVIYTYRRARAGQYL